MAQAVEWERGIGVASQDVSSPGRTIAITPAIRALDEIQRRARETRQLDWKRPVPAVTAPVSDLGKVFSMKNRGPRKKQRHFVFSNCKWCGLRESQINMKAHVLECAKRPEPRRKPSPAQPSPAQPSPAQPSPASVESGLKEVKPFGERSWFLENELDERWAGLSVEEKWNAVRKANK